MVPPPLLLLRERNHMSSFTPEAEQAVRDAAQSLINEEGLVDEWVLTFSWLDNDGGSHVRSAAKGSSAALVGMTEFARQLAIRDMMGDVEEIDD